MGTRSRTHIVHREREKKDGEGRREGEGRRGGSRSPESGTTDEISRSRERAQIHQIVDAADAGESESRDYAAASQRASGD